MVKLIKVLIAGLQNSGKTSILLALQRKYSQIGGVKPTKGVERTGIEILGHIIKVWDLGGQEEFREKYFEKQEEYFGETDLLFYVVDILDSRKYYEALSYYLKIIEIFKNQREKLPQIVIFIHKYDPDLQNDEIIIKNVEKVRALFTQEDIVAEFFDTSIYNEWSLVQGFSYGIVSLSRKEKALKTQLAEFANKTDSIYVLLLDKNRVMIGNYKEDEMHRILGERLMPIIDIYSDIKTFSIYKLTNLIAQLSQLTLFLKQIQVKGDSFYLMIVSRSQEIGTILETILPKFVKNLEETLKDFLMPFQKQR
ncbi:MAG: ADP-ribosylation factor-like protein [Candidatus Helarchaeota archaeon]